MPRSSGGKRNSPIHVYQPGKPGPPPWYQAHGVTLSRHRILRFSLIAGVLVLLLAGCSGSTTSHGPTPASANSPVTEPATEDTGTPATEGTGTESPLPQGSGGVSLSVPGAPIGPGTGPGNVTDEDVCVDVQWLGDLRPMTMLTVTNIVVDGPFRPVGLATAGCTGDDGPPCEGLRFTAADKGMTCAVGLAWTGVRATSASLELAGELSCPHLDSSACQQLRSSLEAQARAAGPLFFDFNVPPVTSSPPATSSTSPPAASSTSPPATSSTSPPVTSSP